MIILKHTVQFPFACSQFPSELTVPSYVVLWVHLHYNLQNPKFVNRQSDFVIATPALQINRELNKRDGPVEKHWLI